MTRQKKIQAQVDAIAAKNPVPSDINWDVTREDDALIRAIVERAKQEGEIRGAIVPVLDLQMDLIACHLNGCPLDLDRLLKADSFNFWHDIAGIRNHMDRKTGKITNHFLPRCSIRRQKDDKALQQAMRRAEKEGE